MDILIVLTIGFVVAIAPRIINLLLSPSPTGLARREKGWIAGFFSILINFLYFVVGAFVSLYAPEIRAFLESLIK